MAAMVVSLSELMVAMNEIRRYAGKTLMAAMEYLGVDLNVGTEKSDNCH